MRSGIIALLLLGVTGCAASYYESERAPSSVRGAAEGSPFYDDLAPYGRWFQYGSYGWVWSPYAPIGWRPYNDGYWAYTEYGWTWVSFEPWGWAPFHYGRWLADPVYGWVWVPDDVWGPAWVAWRWSDDWVGWAPLPPSAQWQAGAGLSYGGPDLDRDLDAQRWCFVGPRWILDRGLHRRVVPLPRNVTLIGLTKPMAGYGQLDRRPVNRGPDVGWVEKAVGRPVARLHVKDLASRQLSRGGEVKGGSLGLFRPAIEPPRAQQPQVTPLPKPRVLPEASMRAQEAQRQRRLESYLRHEQRRLDVVQRRELRRMPAGVAPDTLRRRHQVEQRAFDEWAERQRRQPEPTLPGQKPPRAKRNSKPEG
ncbi:MAG TPA: DUF6600 domain-containing protein [Candidatus Eisenbacteria bacterium]